MLALTRRGALASALAAGLAWTPTALRAQSAPTALAGWNDGAAKRGIEAFVRAVSSPGPDFVPPAERVAVFDNDGTLWVEAPLYTEFAFSMARVAQLARSDPALAAKPAVQAIASGDPARLAAITEPQLLELVTISHSDLTVDDFQAAARGWLSQARHPRLGRLYTQATYRPMVELMNYLRAADFSVYIVSGGDADFMRTFAEAAYGVPPQNVIGSSSALAFETVDGRWQLRRTGTISMDDGPTKPVNIALHIGRRPIFAAGNSDGDLQMLQYATSGSGRRMGLLVHHDDAVREYAYDRGSKVGALDKALDAAGPAGWTVVSMRSDWNTVFANAESVR